MSDEDRASAIHVALQDRVHEGVYHEQADNFKADLEETGATVEVN